MNLKQEDYTRLAGAIGAITDSDIASINDNLSADEPAIETAFKEFVKVIRDCCPEGNLLRYQLLAAEIQPIAAAYGINISGEENKAYQQVKDDLTEMQRGFRPRHRAPYLQWLFRYHPSSAFALIDRLKIYDPAFELNRPPNGGSEGSRLPKKSAGITTVSRLKLAAIGLILVLAGFIIGLFSPSVLSSQPAADDTRSNYREIRVTETLGGAGVWIDGSGFDFVDYEMLSWLISSAEVLDRDDYKLNGRCEFAKVDESVLSIGGVEETNEYLRLPAKVLITGMSEEQIRSSLEDLRDHFEEHPTGSGFYIETLGDRDDCDAVLYVPIAFIDQRDFQFAPFVNEIIARGPSGAYKNFYISSERDMILTRSWTM